MRSDFRHQYQHIAQSIKDKILAGEMQPGERLMSERMLGQTFGVQRNTVRQALEALETEGHIATQGRRGSFVLPPSSTAKGGTLFINVAAGSGPNGAALFDGVAEEAAQAGLKLLRTNTEPLPDSMMNRVPAPGDLSSDAAGVILWPHLPIDVAKLQRLNEAVPVVLVDRRVSEAVMDCIRFDDVQGGKALAEHLIGRGHRRIAFLTDEVFAESVQGRWQGYMIAHEQAGVKYDSRLSLLYQFIDPELLTMTLRHLRREPATAPTAVVCSNDLVAFSLLRVLNAEGLRVPEDIAVTGYGDSMPDYNAAISLTTMDQPFYRMGLEAARLLIRRSRQSSQERLRSPEDICLPVTLVVRGST